MHSSTRTFAAHVSSHLSACVVWAPGQDSAELRSGEGDPALPLRRGPARPWLLAEAVPSEFPAKA